MSTPEIIEVEVTPTPDVIEALIAGPQGGKGDTGNPGIYVGPTPPPDPQENDLWLDTSA